MLAEAGITARFGADMPGHFTEIKVEEGLDGVESYAAGMIRHIEGLTYLPKSIVQGSTVNFVNTVGWNVLVPGSDDVQGSAHYDSENGRINLAVMNGNYETIIHEFMHRAHAIACKDVSDTELEAEYNKALELLGETDHKTEYGRFDPDVFMRTGIPTEHARDTHFELFAELSTDLLLGGYIDNSDENVKDSPALRLQEMVVERLQKAYPDVDWPTVLQFAAVFKNFPRGEVSPQTIIENKISPLDKIWGDIADLASPKVTFQPAIELRQSNDESRYIYVYESEGYYELYYSRSGNNELDNLLGKAATNYMQRIADQNGGGIAWDRLELDEYGKVIGVRFQFRTS
jgi:hypothetical protein